MARNFISLLNLALLLMKYEYNKSWTSLRTKALTPRSEKTNATSTGYFLPVYIATEAHEIES